MSRLLRVQTLALVWPETLIHSHRLSYAAIEFEPAQFVLESRGRLSLVLVWPEAILVDES